MLRNTVLTGVALWLSATASWAQMGGGGSNPPVRWWSIEPDKLLEPRLLNFTQKKPELTAAARELSVKNEAKIKEYRAGIQAEVAKLDADREALRKNGYQGTRAAWNEWFERNRKLYEPIQTIINGFGRELDGLAGSVPVMAAAAGMTGLPPGAPDPTAANPYTAPVGGPPPLTVPPPADPTMSAGGPLPSATIWATADFVEAQLGRLPEFPGEDAVRAKAEAWQAGRTLDDNQTSEMQNLVRKFTEKLAKFREKRARDIERLPEVVRIVRIYPSSLRPADVTAIHDHWVDLVESANRLLADFESDLKRIK